MQLIARRYRKQLRAEGEPRLDVAANFAVKEPCTTVAGGGWLHRKGATPDGQGDYPRPRRDYSWLVSVVSEESPFSPRAWRGRKMDAYRVQTGYRQNSPRLASAVPDGSWVSPRRCAHL